MKHRATAVWYTTQLGPEVFPREKGYQKWQTIVTIQDEPRQSDEGLIVRAQQGLAGL